MPATPGAARGALAVRTPTLRAALLPRVLGIYIAGLAGGIQLLDIAVDRLALDDRIFTLAITLAVVGIPFAGAGAVLVEAARAERRPPPKLTARAPAAAPASAEREPVPVGDPERAAFALRTADLPRRLELALSYLRIAELHAESGDEAVAAEHRERSVAELQIIIEALQQLARDA